MFINKTCNQQSHFVLLSGQYIGVRWRTIRDTFARADRHFMLGGKLTVRETEIYESFTFLLGHVEHKFKIPRREVTDAEIQSLPNVKFDEEVPPGTQEYEPAWFFTEPIEDLGTVASEAEKISTNLKDSSKEYVQNVSREDNTCTTSTEKYHTMQPPRNSAIVDSRKQQVDNKNSAEGQNAVEEVVGKEKRTQSSNAVVNSRKQPPDNSAVTNSSKEQVVENSNGAKGQNSSGEKTVSTEKPQSYTCEAAVNNKSKAVQPSRNQQRSATPLRPTLQRLTAVDHSSVMYANFINDSLNLLSTEAKVDCMIDICSIFDKYKESEST